MRRRRGRVRPSRSGGVRVGLVKPCREWGGILELVENGHSGFLIERGDVGALTSAVKRLSADLPRRREMGGAARARTLMFTNQEKLITEGRAVYIEIGRRHGRRKRKLASHYPG
jgi:hypothetical protein